MTDMDNKARIRRYKGILNFITIICILAGCMIHICGAIGRDIWNSVFNRDMPVSAELRSASSTPGSFSKIDADLDMGDLVITKGSEYRIDYRDFPEDLIPQISNNNGCLNIRQKKKGFDWSPFDGRKLGSGKIEITIPEGQEVSLELNLDLGSFTADSIAFDKADVNASMGSVDFKGCSARKMDLDASMGSITLRDTGFKDAEIDADMGSIEINGEIGDLQADCDMGSIDINSTNDLSGSRLDLNTDMGSITVNGSDKGSKYTNH